jgi:hypothetical protein
MTWLTEDPTWIIILAAVVEGVLIIALLTTRLVKVLAAIGVVAALAVVLVLVEWLIVTDREQVQNTLQRLVANVKGGRVEAVVSDISSRPEGLALQTLVRRYLPEVDVERIAIQELDIHVDAPPPPNLAQAVDAGPRWARAELRALVAVSGGAGPTRFANPRMTLIFAPEQDRWVLVTFESYEGAGENLLQGVAVPVPE